MKGRLYTTVLLALVACVNAKATSFFDRSVEEIFNDAAVVAIAQVWAISAKCVNRNSCPGYRIELRPTEVMKDLTNYPAFASQRMEICSVIQLEVGHTYTVFLERPRAGFFDEVKECRFVLDKDAAFEERAGDYYRINSHDSDIVFSRFDNTYYSNAVLAKNFKESVDALAKSVRDTDK